MEVSWFTDGSSFFIDGQWKAGAAVVSDLQVIWAKGLSHGTSAQKAELTVLTKVLELRTRKRINIYTDSRYTFATAHVHRVIYQQWGLLTLEGKIIKNKPGYSYPTTGPFQTGKIEYNQLPWAPER